MFTFLLQEWTTLRVDKNIGSITQGMNGWLALPEMQDLVFWIDYRGMDRGGLGAQIQIFLETSPLPEESLFLSMASGTLSANSGGATVSPLPSVLLNQNPTVPFATWVRWRVSNPGTPTSSSWGGTFRVRVAGNATTKYYR